MLADSANPPTPLMDTNTHNSTAEIVSLSLSPEVIADLWTHYPELSLAILCSFLPWTGAPQRCLDQSPLVCGYLLHPLLVVRHLMFFCFHLHVIWGLGSCTHIQPQVTQAHTCTHTCARHRDTNREQKGPRGPQQNQGMNVSDGVAGPGDVIVAAGQVGVPRALADACSSVLALPEANPVT